MVRKPTYEELAQRVKDLEGEAAGRKHAEEALIETQLRYRDLIESAHDLIQSVRPDGSFAFVNPAWLETLGYGEEELPSLNLFDIIHPDSLQHCREAFSKTMSGQRVTDIEATFYAKDGREVYVEGSASPRFIEGEVMATHAIFRDLSKRRLNQEALERHVNDLASLSKGATALVELSPEEDIYHVIGNHLKGLIGDSIVFVSSFDSASESFCVRQALGLGEHMETVLRLVGKHPVGMTIPISNEAKRGLTSGKLENVPGGLHDLSVEEVPKAICQAIEKLLALGDAYAMGFAWGGELFGSASFLMRRGAELKNERIIETFVRQASVALQRRQAEEALRKAHYGLEQLVKERTARLAKAVEQLKQEIEGHRRTEEELRESEEKYRLLAENVTDVIWISDMNFRLTYISPSITRMVGYSVEEAMSVILGDTYTSASLELLERAFAEELAIEKTGGKDPRSICRGL